MIGERSSWSYLIFTYGPNLLLESGLNRIGCPIFFTTKLSLSISVWNIESLSSLPTSIWMWSPAFYKGNVDHSRKAFNAFPWAKSFANMNINDMFCLFNKTSKKYILLFHSSWNISWWWQVSTYHWKFDNVFNRKMRDINFLKVNSTLTVFKSLRIY